MADADLEEYKRLEGVIASLEKLQVGSPQGASPLLSAFIDGTKKQLENLDHKIKEKEKTAQLEQQVAIQTAVDRETALNASEKEAYGGFLKEDYFTKADFGRLETFYEKSYDKLSESGKEEMHHRIWEGIRRDEYQFTDLPKVMREKDAAKIHKDLMENKVTGVPKKDIMDFQNLYEGGKRDEANEILNRQCFRENISAQNSQAGNETALNQASSLKTDVNSAKSEEKPSPTPKDKLDVSSVNLSSLSLAETDVVVKPNIPTANSPVVKSR